MITCMTLIRNITIRALSSYTMDTVNFIVKCNCSLKKQSPKPATISGIMWFVKQQLSALNAPYYKVLLP